MRRHTAEARRGPYLLVFVHRDTEHTMTAKYRQNRDCPLEYGLIAGMVLSATMSVLLAMLYFKKWKNDGKGGLK